MTLTPTTPLAIVGIGASAGGLQALEVFLGNTPADAHLAYVIIQHLSPDHKSMMVELLSKHTAMPVMRAENDLAVEADHVYLIPPGANLAIRGGRLVVTPIEASRTVNLPIDLFLRSLAEDQGERAVGVILSGTGSDGSRGIRTIKEQGGLVLVQDATTARFDGMPRNAIATGLADAVLHVEDIPAEVTRLLGQPHGLAMASEAALPALDEDRITTILTLVRKLTGVDFTQYKPSTMIRRIDRRMKITQVDSLDEYIALLQGSQAEIAILRRELLINVTQFFRDHGAWSFLLREIIPALVRRADPEQGIRIWAAGCSTGEEAYSLAMAVAEVMYDLNKQVRVKIFATDIDRDSVERASSATYPESIASEVSPERLTRFFHQREGSYVVAPRIREMVVFATHNLLKDPPFTKVDLITCRNLLIYLQAVLQRKVMTLFHFSLLPGGYLFLGSSETIGDLSDRFTTLDTKWKIYEAQGDGRRSLPDPLMENPDANLPPRPSTGRPMRFPNEERILVRLCQLLAQSTIPNCMVVDESNDLIHQFGDLRRFLTFPSGPSSLNLLQLLPEELALPVGTALHKAFKDGESVIYANIGVSTEFGRERLEVSVRPIPGRRGERRLCVIFLQPEGTAVPVVGEAAPLQSQPRTSREEYLEQELQDTKENLQATVEELETTNEELQASNEELLAANEELQSVNEELHTVNSEFQSKIDELTTANNDLDNLLSATDVAILFIDKDLRLRRFTNAAARLFNFLDQDIGRPITHFATPLNDLNIEADAPLVLRTLEPLIRQWTTLDGQVKRVRIACYRTRDLVVKGLVLSIVDISELTVLKSQKADLAQENSRLIQQSLALRQVLTETTQQSLGVVAAALALADGPAALVEEGGIVLAANAGAAACGVVVGMPAPTAGTGIPAGTLDGRSFLLQRWSGS